MEINWKEVSKSPGYISLKATLTKDLQSNNRDKQRNRRPLRDNPELIKHFNWIIARAIHYSHWLQKPLQDVLNEWESKRNYFWLGYYQDSKFPKLNPKSDHVGRISLRNAYKTDRWYKNDPLKATKLYFKQLVYQQISKSKRTGKKKRWTMDQKKRHQRYQEIIGTKPKSVS